MRDQQKINQFMTIIADKSYNLREGVIKLSKGQPEHNKRVCEICCYLTEMNIPFYTEVITRFGLRFDIVVPLHIKPIIEVFHSETEKKFKTKKFDKLPFQLKNEIIIVNTKDPWKEELIL